MRRLIAPILFAALSACSSVEEAAAPPPVVALYGPAAETNLTPYPSNRYAAPDAASATGIRVRIADDTTADAITLASASSVAELNEMDGFSTVGGVIASFSGPIDVRGIVRDEDADPPSTEAILDAAAYTSGDAPFLLVDVDPASPERGRARGLVPRYWAQAKDDYYTADEFTLIAQPATPLLPGTRYLFVVTNRLRGAAGGPVVRSALTDELLGGGGDAYGAEVREGLAELESSLGVAARDVVLATSFTTARVLDEMIAVGERARGQAAPALASAWEVETPAQADGRIRFRATFDAPEYRQPAPDGKWRIVNGAPEVQSTVGMEVFLAFADASASGPRPLVIYQHGLGGDKDGCWGTTERLSSLGAAVIAIDSPEHGSRADSPDQDAVTASFAFFGIDAETQTFDIGRARDNFRQMASDQLELVRFIGSLGSLDLLPVGAPDGVPDLDVSHLLYIGHSFGSVQGPTIFALAPEIKQATWNVGGDGLTMLMRDSGTFGLLVNALTPVGTSKGAIARFFAVSQGIVDPGEPLNYAPYCGLAALPGVTGWSPRDVLLQAVIDDNIVPNSSSEALARAAGLSLVNPIVPVSGLPEASGAVTGNLPTGATGGMSQFDRMEGDKPATHGELIFSPEARAQYVNFFATGLSAAHATIEPAY